MYLLCLEEYYIHNIFTKFLNNKVIINFNLNIILKLLFYHYHLKDLEFPLKILIRVK